MPESEFKQIFEAHYSSIVWHITRLTGTVSVGEDLAQEVFLKLYDQAPPDLINARAWLYRVATNLAYNHLRREKIKTRQEGMYMEQSALAFRLDNPAIRSTERLFVREALETLSWRDRTCLLMKFSGYSYAEISEALGVEKSSVGTLLVRAQEKFRREYEGKEIR